jgi:hypothetical protein
VSEHREEFGQARVACVTFAEPAMLRAFEAGLELDRLELYGDPWRRTYQAFGFGRGSVARVWLDPRVWRRYAGLVLRGRPLQRAEQDTLQLGGNAVLDANGHGRWIFRSRGPDDRPPVTDLLAALDADPPGEVCRAR